MRFSKASSRLAAALDRTIAEREELVEALRLTHEYVGWQMLPPVEGWSWYDALRKHHPTYVARVETAAAFRETVRHDISQCIPGREFRQCEVGEDGRCRIDEHYWRSGIAQASEPRP